MIFRSIRTFFIRLKRNKNLENLADKRHEIAMEGEKTRKGQLTFQEFQEFVFVSTEKNKIELGNNIRYEYMEVLFYKILYNAISILKYY